MNIQINVIGKRTIEEFDWFNFPYQNLSETEISTSPNSETMLISDETSGPF